MIEESRFVNANENAIEFMRDGKMATVTFSSVRHINRVLKLIAENPGEGSVIAMPENNGGYLYARIPVKWIKLNAPPKISDERREQMREHMKSLLSQ